MSDEHQLGEGFAFFRWQELRGYLAQGRSLSMMSASYMRWIGPREHR